MLKSFKNINLHSFLHKMICYKACLLITLPKYKPSENTTPIKNFQGEKTMESLRVNLGLTSVSI